MKPKKNLFIKITLTAFLLIYLAVLYTGDRAKDIPMEEIASSMEQDTDITALQKRERADLKHFYQISDGDTKGYFFYKAVSPMSVEEILVVKGRDKNQAASFLENMEAHLASQKNVFGGYGTDQMALLGDAVVETRGNYAFYICGPKASVWREDLLSLIS